MRPVMVVVVGVILQNLFYMTPTRDKDPIQAFGPYGTNPALGECISVGRLYRSQNRPYALGK